VNREDIFLAIIDLPADTREEKLDELCAGDSALKQSVLLLVQRAEESVAYFENFAQRIDLLDGATQASAQTGDLYGHYRLTRQLGRGGMGEVWCAERSDGRFQGEVAIKLLARRGNLSALKRFEKEAHYLAKLTHPNIARLMDAGVGPEQTPYLILEYVQGVAIDLWCNQKRLTIDARLRLFLGVTDAVAHAHTKLLVHSDIKPANVLVTDEGSIKLLDFGIATLLDEGDEDASIARGLTPDYAAPEQLHGETIGTATDVYALGLLLYQLIAGVPARQFDKTIGLEELKQQAAVTTLSLSNSLSYSTESLSQRAAERGLNVNQLRKTVSGELDLIVGKALAIVPEQRYASVAELARDVEHYLQCEPLTIVPATWSYQAGKFVRRHLGGVLTGVLTMMVLVAAVVITTWQSIEAKQQRDTAIMERKRVASSNEFYSLLLEEMGSASGPITALELLDRGAGVLQSQFADDPEFIGRAQFDLARRYGSLKRYNSQLEMLDAAEQSAVKVNDQDLLASILCTKAHTVLLNNQDEAKAITSRAEQTFAGLNAPTAETQFSCWRLRSRLLVADGDIVKAIDMLEAVRNNPDIFGQYSYHLKVIQLNDLSLYYYQAGELQDSLDLLDEASSILEQSGRDETVTYLTIQGNKASVLAGVGDITTAVAIQTKVFERLDSAGNWIDQSSFIALRANYASNLVLMSSNDQALKVIEKVFSEAESLADPQFIGFSHLRLASVYLSDENLSSAEEHLNLAEEYLTKSAGIWFRQVDQFSTMRATIARKRKEYSEAEKLLTDILAKHNYPAEKSPNLAVAAALEEMARLEMEQGDLQKAGLYIEDGLSMRKAKSLDDNRNMYIGQDLALRGSIRFSSGDKPNAVSDLEKAVSVLSNSLGANNQKTLQVQSDLRQYASES